MEIRFQKVSYMAVLAFGFTLLIGCNSGGGTVPTSLTAGTPPPAATGSPTPTPKPASTPTPAPAPTPGGTASATVSWSAPLARVNGTALSFGELAGYKIRYGTSLGNYTYVVDIQDRTATTHTLTGLAQNATYYAVVTSYDTAGKESANSNVVVKAL
jgi:hypothetical protein